MKTKENSETKFTSLEKILKDKTKPKSLRPMRSMVKVRSFKPKTVVAGLLMQNAEENSTQN